MAQVGATTKMVKTLKDGRITIPDDFRRELGIAEGTMLRLVLTNGELSIRPVRDEEPPPGSPWLRDLYANFAPVRAEAAESGYTDEQINEWIDVAVAGYRRDRRG